MANLNPVSTRMVLVGDVFYHPEYNAARLDGDYGNDAVVKKLKTSLVNEGWRMNGDGVTEVTEITKEWQERAVKELTERWEALKAKRDADSNYGPALHVWEHNHVKNGKIRVPKYMGVSGNRRNSLLDEVNLIRYTMTENGKPSPRPLIDQYPVIERSFPNDKERIIAQMLENMGKLEGFAKPSEKSQLLCAKLILEQGGIQDDLRRAFTATTGQKLFGILTLNRRFPECRILDRLINVAEDHPDKLRYGSISGSDTPKLVLRSDPDALTKENMRLETAGKEQLKPLDTAGLEKFLGTKKTNEPKIMKRENIIALQKQNPNQVVSDVANAIIANDSDSIAKYQTHAVAFNALNNLITKVGPEMEAILIGLTKASDLALAIKNVREVLKV